MEDIHGVIGQVQQEIVLVHIIIRREQLQLLMVQDVELEDYIIKLVEHQLVDTYNLVDQMQYIS